MESSRVVGVRVNFLNSEIFSIHYLTIAVLMYIFTLGIVSTH